MKAVALISVALTSVSPLGAASPTPTITPESSRPTSCLAAEFRQFDFWLGRWKVTNLQGKEVGTSEISRVSQGCAIREEWKANSGLSGASINYYDTADHQWHQDWVGGDGTILHLHGGLKDSAMVLVGNTKSVNGTVVNRITWTLVPGGKIKQAWATSIDNNDSWHIAFVGIYEKQP